MKLLETMTECTLSWQKFVVSLSTEEIETFDLFFVLLENGIVYWTLEDMTYMEGDDEAILALLLAIKSHGTPVTVMQEAESGKIRDAYTLWKDMADTRFRTKWAERFGCLATVHPRDSFESIDEVASLLNTNVSVSPAAAELLSEAVELAQLVNTGLIASDTDMMPFLRAAARYNNSKVRPETAPLETGEYPEGPNGP